MRRVVLHIDLDCFYVQEEIRRNPVLKDKPVGVQQRSCCVTCNYIARSRGVQKLSSVVKAKEVCPDLVLIPSVMSHYFDASERVHQFLLKYTKQIEKKSIDEFCLDITELAHDRLKKSEREEYFETHEPKGHVYKNSNNVIPYHDPVFIIASNIAWEIRTAMKQELLFTSSGGIAENKLIAKIASNIKKPDDQTIIFPGSSADLLLNTQLSKIPGIGRSVQKELEKRGITSSQILISKRKSELDEWFGEKLGSWLHDAIRGIDDTEVIDKGPPKTISVDHFFSQNWKCHEDASQHIQEKINELCERLEKDEASFCRKPNSLGIRISLDFKKSNSRSCPFPKCNNENRKRSILENCMKLFKSLVPHKDVPLLKRIAVFATNFQSIPKRLFFDPSSSPKLLSGTANHPLVDSRISETESCGSEMFHIPSKTTTEKWICDRCSKKIAIEMKQEHLDFHIASDLFLEINQVGGASVKRERSTDTLHKIIKEPKITSFFQSGSHSSE